MEWLTSVLDWILDVLLYVPRLIFYEIMEALGTVFVFVMDTVCVQMCINGMAYLGNFLSNIPPGLQLVLSYLHVADGLSMVVCAYIARFLIRRIPFIG